MMDLSVSMSVCVRLPAAVLSVALQIVCLCKLLMCLVLAFPVLSITG